METESRGWARATSAALAALLVVVLVVVFVTATLLPREKSDPKFGLSRTERALEERKGIKYSCIEATTTGPLDTGYDTDYLCEPRPITCVKIESE